MSLLQGEVAWGPILRGVDDLVIGDLDDRSLRPLSLHNLPQRQQLVVVQDLMRSRGRLTDTEQFTMMHVDVMPQ